jgi:hypothetical protein
MTSLTHDDLEILCNKGPCSEIVADYQPETVHLKVWVYDSRHTSKSNPFPAGMMDVRVIRLDNGGVQNMSGEHVDQESGKAVFEFQPIQAAFYEITAEFDGQGEQKLVWKQARRRVQIIPGRNADGSAIEIYQVEFDLATVPQKRNIVFLNAQKSPLGKKEATYVGLFDQAVESDPEPQNMTDFQKDPMLNELDEKRHFVGADSRRFYIQVTDKNPPNVKDVHGKRFVEVDWITQTDAGHVVDDNGGQLGKRISLQEQPDKPGTFVSRALMVVTQERDRHICPIHSGYENLYSKQDTFRKIQQSDFRIRKGVLQGKSVVYYPVKTSGPEEIQDQKSVLVFPTSEIKLLPVQFLAFDEHPDDPKVLARFRIALGTALTKTREVLGAIGIFTYTASHSVAERLIKENKEQATRFHLTDHPEEFGYILSNKTVKGADGKPVPIDRLTQKDQFNIGSVYPFENDWIRIFLVRGLLGSTGTIGFGFSFPEVVYADFSVHSSLFSISDLDPKSQIIAHELIHILTNKPVSYGQVADPAILEFNNAGGHYQRPEFPSNNRFRHFYNLMGGKNRKESKFRFRLWDVDVPEEVQAPFYRGKKNELYDPSQSRPDDLPVRTFNQYKDARKSLFLHGLTTRKT